jgi:acetyltransferase-like isoleucine patch superfamily enzyme
MNKPAAVFEDPVSLLFRVRTKLFSLWLSATYPFASKGGNLSAHYPCKIDRRLASQIKIGKSVVIGKDTWLNVIPEGAGDVRIILEDNCAIGPRCQISAKNGIHLEHDVIVAASSLIMDHNHAYEDIATPIRHQGVTAGGRIRIEQGCWVGQGAAIVCGEGELVIGRNSVVAANALVTRSFPPYSVIVGNPARLARKFDTGKNVWVG